MGFLPRPRGLTDRFSIDELDASCLHPQPFVRKYKHDRLRFLAALTIVDPRVSFSKTDRAKLFHHELSSIMSDKNASQAMNSLLAPLILDNMQYADPERIVQFAQNIHIILEALCYLDVLGDRAPIPNS